MTKKIKKMINDNKHISIAEIKQDILETEMEIDRMEREATHLAATPMGMRETRWNHMRADARISGIKDRKKFIKKLEIILEARRSNK